MHWILKTIMNLTKIKQLNYSTQNGFAMHALAAFQTLWMIIHIHRKSLCFMSPVSSWFAGYFDEWILHVQTAP